MKHFTLLLLILPLLIGCFDSQPPQNVVGEIVGCLDTNNATFCITEYPKDFDATPPETPATFADIVSSADSGSKTYVGQTVTVTATVRFNFAIRNNFDFITLQTNNDGVTFYVTADDNPDSLVGFQEGKTYTFTLYIETIRLSSDATRYLIWSHETD